MYNKYLFFYDKYIKNIENNDKKKSEQDAKIICEIHENDIKDNATELTNPQMASKLKNLSCIYFSAEKLNSFNLSKLEGLQILYPNHFRYYIKNNKYYIKVCNEYTKISVHTHEFISIEQGYTKHYKIKYFNDIIFTISYNGAKIVIDDFT